jgi:hypothetical protein
VLAQPPAAVRHDRQHRHDLGDEHEPRAPVEHDLDDGPCATGSAWSMISIGITSTAATITNGSNRLATRSLRASIVDLCSTPILAALRPPCKDRLR